MFNKSRLGMLAAAALAMAAAPAISSAYGAPVPNDRNLGRRAESKRIKRETDKEAIAKAEAKRQRKLAKRAREVA